MNLTETLSPFVCLGYIFSVKWHWITQFCNIISSFSVPLNVEFHVIYIKKNTTSTIKIFSLLYIFCVAITHKKH